MTTADIVERLVLTLVVLVLALALRFFLVYLIRRVTDRLAVEPPHEPHGDIATRTRWILARASGLDRERHRQRVGTLGSTLRYVLDVVLVTAVVLTILSLWGVPMTPFLASAGIGGIAIGFGAQSLVKDYISGIFLLAEDQYGIGDFIQLGDQQGTVEQVTLRITKLRDEAGTIWYIRNGEILRVGNRSQGYAAGYVDITVALEEDPDRVVALIEEALDGMMEEPDWEQVLLAEPLVLGIDSMTEDRMTIRVKATTTPGRQGAAMREVRLRAARACEQAGVELMTEPSEE